MSASPDLLMDVSSGVLLDGTRLLMMVQTVIWTSLRVGAAFMASPLLGGRSVPMRVRLLFTLIVSAAISPWQTMSPELTISAVLVFYVAREIAIGLVLGFMLRLVFEAASLAGELVAQGMGLSFAQMADPTQSGMASGIVGQWFFMVFALIFFTMDGHLAFIELLLKSYQAIPINGVGGSAQQWMQAPVKFLGVVLGFGVRLALPVMMAMLIINLAFGILSRTAPSLNPLQIGVPLALFVGIFLLGIVTSDLQAPVSNMFHTTFSSIDGLLRVTQHGR